ncbi:MAG: flippase-like domain-containing protein [Desulfobacterales bacterium]|nr:flippase-like domain-containing protein [Desulfobacterales bacterium]
MRKNIQVKLISNSIIFISLIFLLIYLYRIDLFIPLKIVNAGLLILSVLLLFMGFILDALSIKIFLKYNNVSLSLSEAIVLTGKYSLAKYIPGKIGVIIGKAAYIVEKANVSNYRSLENVTVYHILFLLSAAILSVITSYNYLNRQSENLFLIILLLILLLFLLSLKKTQLVIRSFMKKLFRKDFYEVYSQRSIILVLVGAMFCWLFWVAGFWLLSMSVGIKITIKAALLFPLATIVGVIAFFAPGGIGVKEGVISAGLIFFGVNKTDSISVSVYSRLWYLFGEVLFFMLAIIISCICNKKPIIFNKV